MNEGITELTNIWARVKQELAKTVEDQRFFDVFLGDSSIYSIENNTMTIIANSGFAVSILSQKYEEVIKTAVKVVYGQELNLKFDVKENLKQGVTSSLEEKPTFFKNTATNSSLSSIGISSVFLGLYPICSINLLSPLKSFPLLYAFIICSS